MLLWGQSVPAALPPFPQKSAVICGKELVKGIARLLHINGADEAAHRHDQHPGRQRAAAPGLDRARGDLERTGDRGGRAGKRHALSVRAAKRKAGGTIA